MVAKTKAAPMAKSIALKGPIAALNSVIAW